MPTRPRHNPRRVPCTWCQAGIANPCIGPNSRELTWYHEPRTRDASQLPDVHDDPPPLDHPRPGLPAPVATRPTRDTTHPSEVDDGPADADLRHEPRRAHTGLHPPEPPRPRDGHARRDTPSRPSEPRSRHKAAREWLRYQLATLGGTAPARDLVRAAAAAGYSRTTLHRARQQLHITTTKPTYNGGWHWNLPPQQLEPSIPETAMTSLTHAGQLALTINTRARRNGHAQP